MENEQILPLDYFAYLDLTWHQSTLRNFIKENDMEDEDLTWSFLNEFRNDIFEYIQDENKEHPYNSDKLIEDTFDFILEIKCIGMDTSQRLSTTIDDDVDTSDTNMNSFCLLLRRYYCTVMDCMFFDHEQKFKIIYLDLVIPQLMIFEKQTKHEILNTKDNHFTIQFSHENSFIHEKNVKLVTCGRIPTCTIPISNNKNTVSRCNFILIKVRSEYIILSGWSFCGTRCISREYNGKPTYYGDQSFMRFQDNESFIIEIGDAREKQQITFNPKTCVICLENRCEIRGSCKHAVLCKKCYEEYKEQEQTVSCPICREIYQYEKKSQCLHTYLK